MLEAVAFCHEIRNSSSLPLVVRADDDRRYVVKLRGGGDGELANLSELLAAGLGRLLGLPVLEPVLIHVAPGLVPRDADPEIIEPAERSVGPNFATPYLETIAPFRLGVCPVGAGLAATIFLFDVFLLNIDRSVDNPNLATYDGSLVCLDFAASMMVRGAIMGADLESRAVLQRLRNHPFYDSNIVPDDFLCRLEAVADNEIRALLARCPHQWLTALGLDCSGREALVDRLIAAKHGAHAIRARLAELRLLIPETAQTRRARAAENLAAFKRRFGQL